MVHIQFPEPTSIPEYARITPLEQREYLIGGEIKTWQGPLAKVFSPVYLHGEPVYLGQYPMMTGDESMKALAAAVKAYDRGQGQWPTLRVEERIQYVREFAYAMQAKKEEVVRWLMWEIGKSHADSIKEFERSIAYIMDTIEALKELDRAGSHFTLEQGIIAQIRRAPLGVTLCMGPFNYPLNETFTLLIPALIMGNTVVLKPPKLGILLYYPLLEALRDCFPPGVVNTVYGDGATIIGPLMESGQIDVFAFIGSAKVANLLKKQHPTAHKFRSVLGMGAKNPAIILEDADLDLTVAECISGSLSFNGQRCTALKILFVQSGIVDAFLEKLNQALQQLKSGMPWEPGVNITPLPEPGKPEYLAKLVEDACQYGAKVLNSGGGTWIHSYFHPALIYPIVPQTRLYREEQFGPIVPIVPFKDLKDAVAYIVSSNYGQQASIFGNHPETIARLIDPLVNQVCRINLNSQCQRGPDMFPFTGRKESAEGTLSVSDALRVFSIRTLVAAKENALNQQLLTAIVRERKSNFLSSDFIF